MLFLATLGTLFAVAVALVQAHRLARFEVHSFDLAIFAQGLWNTAHGRAFSSIQEAPFLAVHFSPLLVALAPLARVAGSATPVLLVFVQGLALGASAPLACLLAARAGRGPSLLLGAAVLAQPAVRALALDGFHDVTLGVPLCLLLALAIERGWSPRRLVLVALATAVSANEVFPLVLPGAALWLFFERRRREAGALLAIGVGAFVVVNFVVLGWLRGGALHVESLYDHWKDWEQLRQFLASGAVRETLGLLFFLLAPLAWLPLLRPTRLAPGAIVLALSFASKRAAQRSIEEHYHAPLVPFLIAGAAAALVRLEEKSPGRGARLGAALLVATTLAFGLVRADEERAFVRDLSAGRADPRAELVAAVPSRASVLASVDFLHALSARERLFGLPAALRGTKDWSQVPYELPELDSVLVDTLDTACWPPALDDRHNDAVRRLVGANWERIVLDRGLGVIAIEGSTVLLGRGGTPLVEAVEGSSEGRALVPDPDAPLLVDVGRYQVVWAPPPSGKLGSFYVETEDGSIRPLLWRLYEARRWPAGRVLRERTSEPPGPLRLHRGPLKPPKS